MQTCGLQMPKAETRTIAFRVPKHYADVIERRAAEQGVSTSAYLQAIVADRMGDESGPTPTETARLTLAVAKRTRRQLEQMRVELSGLEESADSIIVALERGN